MLLTGAPCPPLTLPNTNATALNSTLGINVHIGCNPGYYVNESSYTFTANCTNNASEVIWTYDEQCVSEYNSLPSLLNLTTYV